LIHVFIETWLQAHYTPSFAVVWPLPISLQRNVAATTTTVANGVRLAEIPNTALEPKVSFGQCADGTDIDDIGGVVIIQNLARKQANLRLATTVEDPDLIAA
jgi:hypothetical protein